MRTHRVELVLAACMAVGCGGGSGDASLALDDMSSRYAEVFCAKAFDCCSASEVMEMFEFFNPPITDEAGCRTTYGGLIEGFLVSQIQDSEQAGRLVYHGDLAGACLNELEAMSCTQFAAANADNGFASVCESPIEGKVANGDSCAWDDDCQEGYCEGDMQFESTPGVCKTPPGDGEPCPDFQCADGYYCDFASGSSCVSQKSDGAECTSDDQCQNNSCNGTDNMGGAGTCGAAMECQGQ